MLKRMLISLLLLFTGIGLFVAFFSASANTAATNESTLIEYPIPTTNGGPQSIVAQDPGHIWFTLPEENAIGELVVTSTVDYQFHIHHVLTSNSEPYDLVFDGQYIWFTERAGNRLGQLDPVTKIITETILTPANSMPTSIDVAPNGYIWLTKPGTPSGNISRYDPGAASDPFQDYTYTNATNPTATPKDISVVNNNAIAFTVPDSNLLVELALNPTTFKEVPLNTVGSPSFPPGGVTNDGQGAWVSAPTKGWFGRHVPGTLSNFLWLGSPSNEVAPTAIYHHADGVNRQIWYVGTSSNHIGNIVVDPDGRKINSLDFVLPQANSYPSDIVVDDNLHAWIAESGSNTIAEWKPPYVMSAYVPIIIK